MAVSFYVVVQVSSCACRIVLECFLGLASCLPMCDFMVENNFSGYLITRVIIDYLSAWRHSFRNISFKNLVLFLISIQINMFPMALWYIMLVDPLASLYPLSTYVLIDTCTHMYTHMRAHTHRTIFLFLLPHQVHSTGLYTFGLSHFSWLAFSFHDCYTHSLQHK